MRDKKDLKFDTLTVHGGLNPEKWDGSTQPPIFQSASHRFETPEELSDAFAGKKPAYIYQRLRNPTTTALEERVSMLEGGAGAVALSSGMAAVTAAVTAIAGAGDDIVCSNSLFMSTYLLFTKVLPRFGIKARLVEATDYDAWREAVGAKTKLMYVETIGNPKMDVPDIARLGGIASGSGTPLIVDNTLATPYLFRPFDHGAHIVLHSTTKYLSGHGNALGGVVIDSGKFDWAGDKYPGFAPFVEKKGELAFLDKVWREIHINFGTTQAPFHSYLTMIGLDTLALRMRRHLDNAVEVAGFLDGHPAVKWVNFPGLESSPHRDTAAKQFGGSGFGALMTFGLADEKACFEFVKRLKLIYHLANLGDCKTLVIHPSSSQYISFDEPTRRSLGITPDLLRLSVGIESADDIIEDIDDALKGI